MSAEPGNRYLTGDFAPVTEETTAVNLPVTGRIPESLTGRYLRNGPNALGVDDPAAHLWTTGDGMVHGVRIRDGKAEWYRNRWVRSAAVLAALGEPARDTGLNPWQDFASNIHVLGHAGRTVALVEAGALPYELNYELETVGPCDLGVTTEGFSANAHSKVNPLTGELHSVAYMPGVPFAQHIVTDASGAVVSTTKVPTAMDTPYMHDFALTESHVVVFDTPLMYDLAALRSGAGGAGIRWNPEHGGRVGVLPLTGGDVRWLDSDQSHISHVLNAYDDGTTIILDVIRVDGPVDAFDPSSGRPTLDRWTIDLSRNTVETTRLDDRPQDFPRVNESVVSRPYRYGYSVVSSFYGLPFPFNGNHPDAAFSNAIVKHDLHRGTTEVHGFADAAAVSEAAFAAGEGRAEDDGYLMAYVHNPERGASDLVILPAQDIAGGPVARVHLPVRVPLGLHGSWIPDA